MTMLSAAELGSWPPLLALGYVLATNLFLATMPSAPDVALGLFEYPGFDEEFTMNETELEFPRIQLVSRAGPYDWALARANLDAARRALTLRETIIGGVRYLRIYALRTLTSDVRDDLQRVVLTCDLQVSKVPS